MRLRAFSSTEINHGLAFRLPEGFELPPKPQLSDYPAECVVDTWYKCEDCPAGGQNRHMDHDLWYGRPKTRHVIGMSEPQKFLCPACVGARRKLRTTAAALHAPGMKGKV